MINVILVDLITSENDNGVKTYINCLLDFAHLNAKRINYFLLRINLLSSAEYINGQLKGVDYHEFPLPFTNRDVLSDVDQEIIYYNRVLDILDKKLRGLQNLVFHFNWIDHFTFAGVVKKRYDCRTVLTMHCISWKMWLMDKRRYQTFLELESCLNDHKPLNGFPLKLQRERMGYSNYDKIITVTNSGKQNLTAVFGVNPNKICVIYNGIYLKRLKSTTNVEKTKLKLSYGFDKSDKIILFVGRDEKLAGFLLFFKYIRQLLKEHNNLKLIVIGDIDSRPILKQSDDVWAKIVFTNHLSKSSLSSFYKIADLGIIPSLYEQCSYVCLEMMQSNIPLIVSKVDGLKELVSDKFNGALIPITFESEKAYIDEDYLKDAMLEILTLKDVKNNYIKNSQKKLRLNHNIESMVMETSKIYEGLIKRNDFCQSNV